jgi:hypothetical protein
VAVLRGKKRHPGQYEVFRTCEEYNSARGCVNKKARPGLSGAALLVQSSSDHFINSSAASVAP